MKLHCKMRELAICHEGKLLDGVITLNMPMTVYTLEKN